MTFPILRGEMAKRGLTPFSLAKETGIAYATITAKLNKSRDWKWTEVKMVKAVLKTNMPIEELFSDDILED